MQPGGASNEKKSDLFLSDVLIHFKLRANFELLRNQAVKFDENNELNKTPKNC